MSGKEKTMEEITANPIFKGQLVKFPKKIEGNHTIRLVTDPQKYNFIHLDETGKHPKVTIKPIEGDKNHQVFVPSEADVFSKLEINNDSMQHFWTIKPQTESMTFNLDYGSKTIHLTLPQVFFQGNEPMHIITSHWNFTEENAEQNSKTPIFTMPGMDTLQYDQEDTLVMTEITKETMEKAGFKGGENILPDKKPLNDPFDLRDFVKSMMTNTGGGIGQTVDNYALLREFFPSGKFYIKEIKGHYYVIFKGFAGLRQDYNAAKYALFNPKVIALSIAREPLTGSMQILKESLKSPKGTIIGIIITGAVDLGFWLHDGIFSNNGFYLSELLIEIGSDVIKGIVATVVSALVVGLTAMVLVALGVGLSAFWIIAGAIAVGIMIGVGLDALDNHLQVTKTVQNYSKRVEESIRTFIDQTYIRPVCNAIQGAERAILRLYEIPSF